MKAGEIRLGDALRQLLEKVPIVEIKEITSEAASGEGESDMVARLLV